MCGISGFLRGTTGASPATWSDISQGHRGPDDAGRYEDARGRATLFFRRLSIIDLSTAGHQPMSNEDGTVWLVFNGEIYNWRPLRNQLERQGHRFRSRTDSEVLVHLWEEHGRGMVDKLNGMFAFCIWDARTGEAFVARDHAGIKPLYYALTHGGLAFASEAKVLLQLDDVDQSVDPIALQQYLTFLWVPGAHTMWRGVRKLEPGCWLAWRGGQLEQGAWWDWDQSRTNEMDTEEWRCELRRSLSSVVERQLMSDVPVGVLLSGGLDSSTIAAAMREKLPGNSISAYTARLQGTERDGFASDLPYARQVGRQLDLRLVEEDVSPSITSLLPSLIWHMDEPLADPAIAASYLLCRRAREDGTIVLLSGQGADELYHGYRSHRAVRLARRMSGVPAPLARMASALAQGIAGSYGVASLAAPRRLVKMLRFAGASTGDRILQLADWSSIETRDTLLASSMHADKRAVYGDYLSLFDRSRGKTDEERWSYVLFKTFLPALNLAYADRTSMAVSVELRVPFLDRELIEQAGRIPAALKYRNGQQKWILAQAARGWLSPSVISRPKTGFGAPLRHWLSRDLSALMRETLLSERFQARGFFQRTGVEKLLSDLASGRRDVAYIVWALFTLELWARTFSDQRGQAPTKLAA